MLLKARVFEKSVQQPHTFARLQLFIYIYHCIFSNQGALQDIKIYNDVEFKKSTCNKIKSDAAPVSTNCDIVGDDDVGRMQRRACAHSRYRRCRRRIGVESRDESS